MDEDLILLQKWRGGDQSAGNRLFQRCFEPLYRFVANKTRSASDTEDLMQKTFEVLVANRDKFEGRSTFRTYVLSVAYNLLKKYYRSLSREPALSDYTETSLADIGAGPHSQIECAEQQRILLDALRQIPIEFQIVIELRYLEDLTPEAIAEILEVNPNTVRSRIQRAREKLIQKIAETADKHPDRAGRALLDDDAWRPSLTEAFQVDPAVAPITGEQK
jgi:RNA polymerase sigma-70 factor, ECF subfamily